MLECGLDAGYVLDRMQMYEARTLMGHSASRDRDGWEQARLIAYTMAQCNSRSRLKLEDIVRFPWEKPQKREETTPEDFARLKARAQMLIDNNLIN